MVRYDISKETRKGSPNRDSYSVRRALEQKGVDVLDEILARIPLIDDPVEQAKIYLTIMRFCYPIPTALSADPDQSEDIKTRVQKLVDAHQSLIAEKKALPHNQE